MIDTVKALRMFIEYAPTDPGPMASDLLGWWTPDGYYVCARCAGRIMARGCSLPTGSDPAWVDTPIGVCCCCAPEYALCVNREDLDAPCEQCGATDGEFSVVWEDEHKPSRLLCNRCC